jgi:aerobic carbon-monoxide dehydrogenase medium subunit
VRLRPFGLHRPRTVDAAGQLLGELGGGAQLYCGGTELLLVAKLGFTDFTDLVDVKEIEELRGIELDGDEVRVGAAVTHREIERSRLVRERLPALAATERHVGNLRVRNMGSIGGNLCFADPHSDPATLLLAAGGSVSLRRAGAAPRRLSIEEFCLGPYRTALEPGELLIGVHVPLPAAGERLAHRKMSFAERPAITVAASVTVADGAVAAARIAVASIGLRPQRALAAERALVGVHAGADENALAAIGDAAAAECEPVADSNGSIEYKRQLVRVLSARCVADALAV